MTIKRQSARCVCGMALMALFLIFLSVSTFPNDARDEPGSSTIATIEANVAETVAFRNSTNHSFMPGLCLKAAGPCLLVALFGFEVAQRSAIHVQALEVNLPRYNPFYVVITTNAP